MGAQHPDSLPRKALTPTPLPWGEGESGEGGNPFSLREKVARSVG